MRRRLHCFWAVFTAVVAVSNICLTRTSALTTSSSHFANTMGGSRLTRKLVLMVRKELGERADSSKALQMQRYLKTDMPFYGVSKKDQDPLVKSIKNEIKIESHDNYTTCVQALWAEPQRESKGLAVRLARLHPSYLVPASMPLYESMLREDYAWWDLVDEIAISLVGNVVLRHREEIMQEQVLQAWNQDDNMWIRRTSILAQLKHKQETDSQLLFALCEARLDEKEFFIRKAIGWALREYAKTNPSAVIGFVTKHKKRMSGLSYREATRILIAKGKMK